MTVKFNCTANLHFGAAHGWGLKKALLPKICHTYPTMMKLGSHKLPKEDPKNI